MRRNTHTSRERTKEHSSNLILSDSSVRFLSQPSHNPYRPTRKRQEEEESVPERCVFVRSVCPPRVRCSTRSQSNLSPVRAHSVRFCQTLVRFHRCLNLPRASPFRTAAIAACPIVLSALYIRACHSTRMRALGREEHSCCHCCLLLLVRLLCRQEAIHRHSKERGKGFGISEVRDGTPGGPILEGEREAPEVRRRSIRCSRCRCF